MDQVIDFFKKLFDTTDWPPRWHCGNWSDFHGWLYIISDLLIWSAYFAIPLVILKYITKRIDAKFVRTYFLFAAFILACGATHFLDAIAFWFPAYRLSALVRFITGVISWITVFHIIRILPIAKSLRTHAELENEISERRKVEEELKFANQQLNEAQEIAKIGHWQWDVATNNVSWSNELYKIYGLKKDDGPISFENYISKIHPEDKDLVTSSIQNSFQEKKFNAFIHRIRLDDGTEKIMQSRGEVITNENGEVIKMLGTGQDITEQQAAQQQLLDRTQDLEITNRELQKFAYVASHDLQEPLRKILTFSSLLEKEIDANINERSKNYMSKIVQSSVRMQKLIDDILQFSSLRATTEAFKKSNLNDIINQVLSDMEVQIEQSQTKINVEPLPEVEVIPSQMGQLFQNLISNAIKFRKENENCVIEISAKMIKGDDLTSDKNFSEKTLLSLYNKLNWKREAFVKIAVKDNGIGFEESYKEKIFEIFQRLHNSKSYEGTGIGLAICKKIIDNHKGMITSTGKQGEGATFIFVLPLSQKNLTDLKS